MDLEIRDLFIEASNAINEVIFQYSEDDWPEKLGYSRADFEKIEDKINEIIDR